MCLGSVCMDLPLIIWRENDVYLPSFQTVALGILFIVGAGPQLFWQIQETGRWKSKTEQICQTHFLAGFSANFCARSLSFPLRPPSFLLLLKRKKLGKSASPGSSRKGVKVLVSRNAGVHQLEGHSLLFGEQSRKVTRTSVSACKEQRSRREGHLSITVTPSPCLHNRNWGQEADLILLGTAGLWLALLSLTSYLPISLKARKELNLFYC